MSELRDLLEDVRRHVRASPGLYEQVLRRHRRRDRNRRMAAGALALAIAGVGVWGAARALHGVERGEPRPASPAIDRTNSSRLAPAWTTRTGVLGHSNRLPFRAAAASAAGGRHA